MRCPPCSLLETEKPPTTQSDGLHNPVGGLSPIAAHSIDSNITVGEITASLFSIPVNNQSELAPLAVWQPFLYFSSPRWPFLPISLIVTASGVTPAQNRSINIPICINILLRPCPSNPLSAKSSYSIPVPWRSFHYTICNCLQVIAVVYSSIMTER